MTYFILVLLFIFIFNLICNVSSSDIAKYGFLHVISWNVNGLNGQIKRTACLDLLCRQLVDIAFIQESHLRTADAHRFANKHYYVAASASLKSKTRGSLIVLKRNLSLYILDTFGSEDGRVADIKTIISGRKFPLSPFMLHLNMNLIFSPKLLQFYHTFRISL